MNRPLLASRTPSYSTASRRKRRTCSPRRSCGIGSRSSRAGASRRCLLCAYSVLVSKSWSHHSRPSLTDTWSEVRHDCAVGCCSVTSIDRHPPYPDNPESGELISFMSSAHRSPSCSRGTIDPHRYRYRWGERRRMALRTRQNGRVRSRAWAPGAYADVHRRGRRRGGPVGHRARDGTQVNLPRGLACVNGMLRVDTQGH